MSSSDFTQRRRHDHPAAARHAEDEQHGAHAQDERAEMADQMLDVGESQGQDHQAQPEDHRQKGRLEKV